MNATRHGLTGRTIAMPYENRDASHVFCKRHYAQTFCGLRLVFGALGLMRTEPSSATTPPRVFFTKMPYFRMRTSQNFAESADLRKSFPEA
jgi:hypothetical protein